MPPFKIKQLQSKDVKFLRQKLLNQCDGICPICKKANEAPCLDHHHIKKIGGTGLVRGVICRSCNVFLAKMENNSKRYGVQPEELPTMLRSFAKYLEQDPLPYMHPSEKPKEPILKKASYNKLKKVYNGRAKFPVYRVTPHGKPAQKMTVKLKKLFNFYDITPEFYK